MTVVSSGMEKRRPQRDDSPTKQGIGPALWDQGGSGDLSAPKQSWLPLYSQEDLSFQGGGSVAVLLFGLLLFAGLSTQPETVASLGGKEFVRLEVQETEQVVGLEAVWLFGCSWEEADQDPSWADGTP